MSFAIVLAGQADANREGLCFDSLFRSALAAQDIRNLIATSGAPSLIWQIVNVVYQFLTAT